jgi:hypothetical protein
MRHDRCRPEVVPVRGFRSELSDSVLVTVLNRAPYIALISKYTDTIRDLLLHEKIRFENSEFDVLRGEHKTHPKNTHTPPAPRMRHLDSLDNMSFIPSINVLRTKAYY